MDRSHAWNGQHTIAKSKHFYMEDYETTEWIQFKNQNLYHVYISEAMNRNLKSVAVTGKRN